MSTPARQAKHDRFARANGLRVNPRPWNRKAPYDFTGCLAHIDITYRPTSWQVLRITGIISHNTVCVQADMKRLPPVPLHEHVWQVALQQLNDGARYCTVVTSPISCLSFLTNFF